MFKVYVLPPGGIWTVYGEYDSHRRAIGVADAIAGGEVYTHRNHRAIVVMPGRPAPTGRQ